MSPADRVTAADQFKKIQLLLEWLTRHGWNKASIQAALDDMMRGL